MASFPDLAKCEPPLSLDFPNGASLVKGLMCVCVCVCVCVLTHVRVLSDCL